MPSAFPNGSQVCVIPPKESVLLPILVEILHNLKFGSILGQRIFPVCRRCIGVECYLCRMKPTQLLRAILPDVLIDNFEVDHFEKTDTRFDIWLDEKKVQMREDKNNTSVISYGFRDYHTI